MTDPQALARRVPVGPRLPPVEDWHPEHRGEIDIRIDRDGIWYHAGARIRRERLWRLFSTILRRDEDGEYYLVTPVEQLRIRVDDAPFLIVALESVAGAETPLLVFHSNCGDRVPLDDEHPLRFAATDRGGPVPYVRVRGRLEGRLTRAVYYELAALAETRGDTLGVSSAGRFFALQ